ncbi:hypothetical protein JOB18_046006 [Solea senegalensis]|uniref:Endonuclease/exonuclease/phosphatase domain-containing protein n=1 Tax=Solea senegalensis TaxID=28829 RepID=A0AAV6TBK1_SOLSE|nr:hypothetical protein JOB18_046006 [Solea senegalensis]
MVKQQLATIATSGVAPERRTGLYGVALAFPNALRRSLISWTPLSDRLLSARFLHQHGKMTAIVAYAPTDVADEDVKDAFFDQLHQAICQAPPHDITIVLTDANATLSSSDRPTGSPVGTTFADRSTNDNGNRLLLLCHHNKLCFTDTWFPRKLIHHWTWYNPDGRTRKALDHILISQRWKSSVTNCRMYRGAELGNTDHRLLLIHPPHLQCPGYRQSDRLVDLQGKRHPVSSQCPRTPTISERTHDIIDRRREARHSGDLSEYRRLNRQRNVAIAEDREKFWQAEAKDLESTASNNNMSRVFSLLHKTCNGLRRKTALVKDSDGNLITTEANCLERWKEHFSLLLQQDTTLAHPTILAVANVAAPSNACNTDPVTPKEVFGTEAAAVHKNVDVKRHRKKQLFIEQKFHFTVNLIVDFKPASILTIDQSGDCLINNQKNRKKYS